MVTGFFALRVKNLVTFYFVVTRFFALRVNSLQVVIYFNYGIIRDLPGGRHYRTIVKKSQLYSY